MLIKPGDIRTWLYTSELQDNITRDDMAKIIRKSHKNNDTRGVTGFMITDGHKVMQLLEGPPDAMDQLRQKILSDERHSNINTEVWSLVSEHAYPKWSMRAAAPFEYEALFSEIENAEIETIATNIATMLFDLTFGKD